MALSTFDIVTFIAFIVFVIVVSLWASRKESSTEDYFLAGRGLTWWLIGFSLIASNISTEHFVGMAGSGFGSMGLAVASYEWIAAVTLVFVALFLLPVFLKTGIYTMPEFLEHRFGKEPRLIMAVYMMIMYIVVALAAVLYSGALGLKAIFDLPLIYGIWLIGILAGLYTAYGGLKAVVWSDLIQGAALLIGGTVVTILGLKAVGGWSGFMEANGDKMHLVLPKDHPDIPWTALLIGIWIPNLYYWGLNQFITQRTLGSKSLAEGQKGIIMAAFIKLIIPFIIVIPGIMAYQLYGSQITNGDEAYPILIKNLLPAGLKGLMFAALFGAVMSSLDSLLNSASTIFTMDIYKNHIKRESSNDQLVKIGKLMTALFVVIGCLVAPHLANPKFKGIFNYIQMFQGFVSPGIVTVFIMGLLFRRIPKIGATLVLLLNIPIYAALLYFLPQVAFLNHMAITFIVLSVVIIVVGILRPLKESVTFQSSGDIQLERSQFALYGGLLVVILTILIYVKFW